MTYQSKLFVNLSINKKELKKIIQWAFKNFGQRRAAYFVDQLKELGFHYATKSGISISLEDLRVPPIKKALMQTVGNKINFTQAEVNNGEITDVERFQKIIYIWNRTSETLKERLLEFLKKKDPLNSVYIMAFSGARGNISQVRQLVGMRGLMSDPNGQIIDQAISANFREGLSITDYIISSYGARKGIVDTAIRTADSGYLTRRLVEIAQSIIISELDCHTKRGLIIHLDRLRKSNPSFEGQLVGRILAASIIDPETHKTIAFRNQQITLSILKTLTTLKIKTFLIRSPLTCECRRAICQQCYGVNIASGNLVELGETVGLIAAQSIGEPGTQLTMRTFHTGGVFTSELTRQARSRSAGYVHFISTGDFKPFRTRYGQDTFLSEREAYLRIVDYSNQIIEVKVDARTIILVKNHVCIKADDVLFEAAPNPNERIFSQKEIKYVLAKSSGEISLEHEGFPRKSIMEDFRRLNKKNYIFWVLSGQVFHLPFGSNIKARKLERLFKGQSISQSKVITTINGFIHICYYKFSKRVLALKIQNSFLSLNSFKLFIEAGLSDIEKCKIYLSHYKDITINPEMVPGKNMILGFLNNKNYRTKTGGKFYSSHFLKQKREENLSRPRKTRGLTVFYVPESTVQTLCKTKEFKFKDGSYIQKNTEILPYYNTNFSGLITFEDKSAIKIITIKPGWGGNINKKNSDFSALQGGIYFPGEIFLNIYIIERLSVLEIIKLRNEKNVLFHFTPITRYEVTNEKSLMYSYFSQLNVKLGTNEFHVQSGENFKTDTPIQFVSYPLIIDYPLLLTNIEVIFELNRRNNHSNWLESKIGTSQIVLVENIIPKEIKKKDIFVEYMVEEKQFVEAYTILASLNFVMPWTDYIYQIKTKQTFTNKSVFLTTTTDYKKLFFEDFTHIYKNNQLIKVNTSLHNNLSIKESGLWKKVLGNHILFQLAEPYLFSKAAIMRKLPGEFIKTHENLGQLVYERLKTGDIIQGLPKVDEILEVRNPKSEALLTTSPGLITHLQFNPHQIYITIKPNSDSYIYQFEPVKRLVVKRFQYVSVGQPLTDGQINPHTLIQVYFRYFLALGSFSLYESAYRSIKKLQTLILKSVQAIYVSQGVKIVDKHIELIVREITRKVYIEYPGRTNFLPGDIVELHQANYINLALHTNNKLFYRPILLGITKSSLKIEGFFAAASFQETTRVLTQAALQGKTDWLQGLKESVITGRLIPAGTAFYKSQDITYNKVLLPNNFLESEIELTLKNSLQIKQLNLKKIIQFRYTE